MIQVNNSPNLLESGMKLQDSERSSKKLWLFITAAAGLILMIFSGLIMYYFLHSKGEEICWAQGHLDNKTEAAVSSDVLHWKWSKMPTFCMEQTENQKLMIMKKGKFFIYGKLKRNRKTITPFAIEVRKGNDLLKRIECKEGDIIFLLEFFDLNEGEEISLELNDDNFDYIEKNPTETYWGISLIASYDS